MVKDFDKQLTSKDIVQSPKDVILDSVIVKIEQGLLSEFLKPEVHAKFDNLEQDTLLIHFETKFNDRIIKSTDRLPFYSEPMSNSKLGLFLAKYESLEVGKQIKVEFNGDGFSSIKIK